MTAPGSDEFNRIAGERGDALLRQLQQGWRPPCTSADLDRARRDAMKAIARDIPDPAEFAEFLLLEYPRLHVAVRDAWTARDTRWAGEWRVDDACVRPLQKLGVVNIAEPTLSNFGKAVRAAILEAEA